MKRLIHRSPVRTYALLILSSICVIAIAAYMIAPPRSAAMTTYLVNSTVDSVDAVPGDGTCADSLGRCTLRAAVMEANAHVGPDTITLPAGTYVLTLGPNDDEENFDGARDDIGDLDVLNGDLTINGAGAASTIIDGGGIDRVIEANDFAGPGAAVNLTISGVTIRNGTAKTGTFGYDPPGGGIQFDGFDLSAGPTGTLTLNNCVIMNNSAPSTGGGVSLIFGSLIVNGTDFTNNTSAQASGGGIAYDAGGQSPARTLQISNSTFSGNHATNTVFGNGAGVSSVGNANVTISNSSFSGNVAGTNGGAIFADASLASNTKSFTKNKITTNSAKQGGGVFNRNGAVSLTFNLIVGNTASTDPTSTGYKQGPTGTITSLANDWWGCNQGPTVSPCDRASGPTGFGITQWLTLSHAATPNSILVNQSTSLQADFFTNNAASSIAATDLVALDGRSVVFNNPVLGTISGAGTQIIGGKANATFNAGATGGNGSADATVDHATVTASIFIAQAPSLTCPSDITVSNDTNSCSASVPFSTSAAGFPTPTVTCKVGATTITSPHTFDVGTTLVQCTSTNGFGTDSSCSFNVTVNDTQNPTITAPAAVTVNTGPGATSCSAVISDATLGNATANDNCAGVTINRSGVPAGNEFPVGTTTVTYTATDAHGHTAAATQSVTVVDNTAPTVTAPAAVTVNTGAGSTSCAVVISDTDLGNATANDNCAGVTVNRTGVPAGNSFPVGTTTVTYTATDAHGNTATATQSVTVVDNTAPTVTAPAAVTVNTGPGATSCGAVISDATLGTASASDNCGTATIVRTGVPAGNNFPVGATTITYTATDSHGNTSTAAQTVTVVDNTVPTITAPSAVTVSTGPGATFCGAFVSDATLGTANANDNCPGVTVNRTGVPAGNNFPVGTTTVTYTATDAHGNTATATQTVTVSDNTPPVITGCAPPQSAVANSSGQAAVPNFTGTVVASDNCGVTSITQSPAAGTMVGLGVTPVTISVKDAANNTSTCNTTFTVTGQALTALGPAQVWVGLKNSDDVGTKFDLLAEVLKNGAVIGSGQLNDVPGGSSSFNNAILDTINMALPGTAVFIPGDTLSIRLSVRVATSSGHVSGTARLWYDDSAANSRFSATIAGVTNTYYLRAGSLLSTTVGPGPKQTSDVLVNRNQNGNPFKPFGTWTKTF